MKLREFFKTKKGQLATVIVFFAVSQLFLLFSLGGCDWLKLPTAKEVSAMQKNLQKLRAEYLRIAEEQGNADRQKKAYRERMSGAWIVSHDGPVETALRRRISEAAVRQNFKLNMLGSVRTGQINSDFSYAEIDLSGEGELPDVIRFLSALRKLDPVPGWKRLDLSPDRRNLFRQNSSSSNLAAKENTMPPTRLNFNGTLRVLIYRGPLSIAALKIKRPAFQPDPVIPPEEPDAALSPELPAVPEPPVPPAAEEVKK